MRQHFVAICQPFFLDRRKFLDAGFHAQGVFLVRELELAEDFFGRKSLGELGPTPCAVLLETGGHIHGVTRINSVPGAAEHVNEVGHRYKYIIRINKTKDWILRLRPTGFAQDDTREA